MIDMELFELMKVALGALMRVQVMSPGKWAQPSYNEIAEQAYGYALAAQRRLHRDDRPSDPRYDQQSPTLQPPSPITNRSCKRCPMRALYSSDFCKDHQPVVVGSRCHHPDCPSNVIPDSDFCIDHQQ